jgi:hypothetical protein
MKTRLGFLTEEGRTRSKNAFRRFCAYAVVMFLIGGAGGYVIHRYWVSTTFSPLQRIYFKQYLKSSYRSYLSRSHSHYTVLVRTVTDPRTKKELQIAAKDDEIVLALDELGRLKYDERHRPVYYPKDNPKHNPFYWQEFIAPDLAQYTWFHDHMYEGQSLIDFWRPAWLGALLIFIIGTIALTILDAVAQRLYLKGEPIRGTKELLPRKYAREYRREAGVAIKTFKQGSEI